MDGLSRWMVREVKIDTGGGGMKEGCQVGHVYLSSSVSPLRGDAIGQPNFRTKRHQLGQTQKALQTADSKRDIEE